VQQSPYGNSAIQQAPGFIQFTPSLFAFPGSTPEPAGTASANKSNPTAAPPKPVEVHPTEVLDAESAPKPSDMAAAAVAQPPPAQGASGSTPRAAPGAKPRPIDPDTIALRHLATSPLLDSGNKFLTTPPDLVQLNGETGDDIEEEAMASAAVFQQHKIAASGKANQPSPRKRKAEDMSQVAEIAERGIAPEPTEATKAADVVEGPPAKRQATGASRAEASKAKAWTQALAEKVGFAALGGAMVLGSLIYTAPSFA